MAKIELLLPKMGESVAEATVTTWLKNQGDHVELEECILEIATDKVDSEIPSTHEGILVEKLCNEGDVIKVGAAFAIIETKGDTLEPEVSVEVKNDIYSSEIPIEEVEAEKVKIIPKVNLPKNTDTDRFYSPLVRSIANKENSGF